MIHLTARKDLGKHYGTNGNYSTTETVCGKPCDTVATVYDLAPQSKAFEDILCPDCVKDEK